jgi:hypothetical protein
MNNFFFVMRLGSTFLISLFILELINCYFQQDSNTTHTPRTVNYLQEFFAGRVISEDCGQADHLI